MKKITKKQEAEANKEITKLFEQYGITKHNLTNHLFSHYPYTMNTKGGMLFIKPECEAGHVCFTLVCIFATVETAQKVIPESNTRLNRWSGKFNFHEPSIAYLTNQFKLEMNAIQR